MENKKKKCQKGGKKKALTLIYQAIDKGMFGNFPNATMHYQESMDDIRKCT